MEGTLSALTATGHQNEPLVSVIVPAYNATRYLSPCMESILGQSYRRLEVVAVNDASRDGTGDLLEAIARKDGRLHVLHLPVNGGLYNARRTGLAAATGSLVSFVDADDYVAAEMHSMLVDSLLDSDSDMAICSALRVDENGKPIGHKVVFPHAETFEPPLLDAFCQLRFGAGVLWNKLYRRALIDDVFSMPMDPALRTGAEEYVLNLRAFDRAKRVQTVPNTLYYYRATPGSICATQAGTTTFAHTLRAYVVALEMFAESKEPTLRSIDGLFSQLFSYYCDSDIPDVPGPDGQHLYLSESLKRLAVVRPQAIHLLLRAAQSRTAETWGGWRAWLKNARRSLAQGVVHTLRSVGL